MNAKKLQQLLKTNQLTVEQLNDFINKTGMDKAIEILVSILETTSRKTCDWIKTLIHNMGQDFQDTVHNKIILAENIFFPFKEFFIESLPNKDILFTGDLIDAVNRAKTEHYAFMRSLEDKSFSHEKIMQFVQKPVPLIVLYLEQYSEKDIGKLEWLLPYFGRWDNFDKAILRVLIDRQAKESVELLDRINTKSISREKMKELKKARHSIGNAMTAIPKISKTRMKEMDSAIAKPYKALISPYFNGKYVALYIANYLVSTEDYVLFFIRMDNKKIFSSDILLFPEMTEVQKMLDLTLIKSEGMFMYCEPEYALYLAGLSLQWHRSKKVALPERLEKYLPVLSVDYDISRKNPLRSAYNYEEMKNYRFYDMYVQKLFEENNPLLSWLMPKKVLAAYREESASGKKSIIELPGQQEEERKKHLMQKYINEFWTAKRRKEYAFKLLHMSYYFYLVKRELLSRLCYAAAIKMKQMKLKPSENLFSQIFFQYSVSVYEVYLQKERTKKRILSPGEDSKGLIITK
ncbi:MAG: hypothetical protein A2Y62_15415 [Candidatus Fischerbacteria bacterium RBG_13_37_8]|uniref:Uncharacterized protein n=1 Tax=Candidatus Fischerbacteria bacterium RBG_13_37_8 TaxID=1817863 RepID=A0A1F5VL14_9BACT|nr:MAG: hypothetical protein A2Y62_15415 [Candidatus Fischerbacteria bacterium RBG_13_37_8]